MSIRNEMQMRMHYLDRIRNPNVEQIESPFEEIQTVIDANGQEQVALLAARIEQVNRVLNREVDQVQACDARPVDASCTQRLQMQIQDLEEKNASLRQILTENATVMEERKRQNIALTQHLSYLEDLKKISPPPGYTERQLYEVGSAFAGRAAQNIKRNRTWQ